MATRLATRSGGDRPPDRSPRHLVHFYESERDLAAIVGDHVARELRAGAAVVAVATEAHRAAFEERVRRVGLDLRPARAAGTYVTLDAGSTLQGLGPEAARFEATIGEVVRRVSALGRPLFVYGELVALLWDAGMASDAIALEERWNELGRELEFTVLCAYPLRPADERAAAALAEIRRLHSHESRGTGDEIAAREFPGERSAPADARRFTRGALAALGAREHTDDVALIVTELATNAVLHAGSGFRVELRCTPAEIRIAVEDAGGAGPVRLEAQRTHGLGIVETLARAWGFEPRAGGTTVWASLPR